MLRFGSNIITRALRSRQEARYPVLLQGLSLHIETRISPFKFQECNKLLDEMVASASAFLEPCEPTLLSPCSSDVERAPSSTLLQDAWKMATDSTEPISKVPSARSVSQITSAQPSPPTPVHTDSSSSDNSEEVFEEMISEEVVITSEDLFLTDAWCGSSAGSEYDSDECHSDQGYESTDLSDSMACERQTLSELFPNLM